MCTLRTNVTTLVVGGAALFAGASAPARGIVANDLCGNATVVTDGSVTAGNTTNASTDGSADCGNSNTAPDVWYLYTATRDGQLVVTTCGGATWDTVISLHSGCPGTAANQLACNDDACPAFSSRVTMSVVRDQVLRIRVAGWSGASGPFQIRIGDPPPTTGGADVLIGELNQMQQFGRVGDTVGCAIDSPLCNAGGEPLDWFANPDPRHPFAVFNLYKLLNGRLSQIGMSWAKHGFGAAQQDACGLGCHPFPNGTRLGLGCSDTYDAATNANQAFLGPRHEINPWTGAYVYEGSHLDNDPGGHTPISHRLQLRDADLASATGGGATFIAEVYIAAHDDEDHMNSVAHETVQVAGAAGGTYTFNIGGSSGTLIGPAIAAWPGATLTTIPQQVVDDGRAILAVKTTDNGDGTWHYEYGLYNHDMDRGVQSLSIPVDATTKLSNVGFAAVRSHNEPYSNDPWVFTRGSDNLSWQTQPYIANPASNPIRWGMMYNFWFDADAPPAATTATLGLFKPGSPATLSGDTTGPIVESSPGDINGDGVVDIDDLLAVISAWGACAPPVPCPADVNSDGQVNIDDLLLVISNWG